MSSDTAMYPGHWCEEWGYECGTCGAPMMYATEPGLCATCEEGEEKYADELEVHRCPFDDHPVVEGADPCPFAPHPGDDEPLSGDASTGAVFSSLMSTIDELIGEKAA
jgi:hypothetical protein